MQLLENCNIDPCQPGHSQVLRFGGQYIFRGHVFSSYYIFKTVSGHNKILGAQKKLRATVPEYFPVAAGLLPTNPRAIQTPGTFD